MTATTAIAASYLLGLVALAIDAWRARSLVGAARQRILEGSEAR